MAGIPRHQGRTEPKVGERATIGKERTPRSEASTDRVVGTQEAGLGGGLDQAEEARLKKQKL
jgi:hypothetical protein